MYEYHMRGVAIAAAVLCFVCLMGLFSIGAPERRDGKISLREQIDIWSARPLVTQALVTGFLLSLAAVFVFGVMPIHAR